MFLQFCVTIRAGHALSGASRQLPQRGSHWRAGQVCALSPCGSRTAKTGLPMPLPLGEVASRSDDGEGRQAKRGFYVTTGLRRVGQRQDDAAVSPHPCPRRGGSEEHPAGAGTVHLLHRGAHLPRTGRCAFRHGGEFFVHEPGRENPVRGGRRSRADPFGRRPRCSGTPRTGRIAGKRPLLLPQPAERGVLPDGRRDHRRAQERGPVRPAAGRPCQRLRGRERQTGGAGPDLSGLRDPARPQRHGPRRPAGAGRSAARRGAGLRRSAGILAGAGGLHRRVRYLQRAQKAAAGGAAGRSAQGDGGPVRPMGHRSCQAM